MLGVVELNPIVGIVNAPEAPVKEIVPNEVISTEALLTEVTPVVKDAVADKFPPVIGTEVV